ncbi:hypothetical protein DMP11_09520 [Parvibacter caecicola]|nr:hypothetical protein DMP11_09520 [Parvibacter caecicola]
MTLSPSPVMGALSWAHALLPDAGPRLSGGGFFCARQFQLFLQKKATALFGAVAAIAYWW